MRRVATLVCMLCLCAMPASAQSPRRADPFSWLEEIEGARALEWVRGRNKATLATLEADPRYRESFTAALAILQAKDRIPYVNFTRLGLTNFWQDKEHVRGIGRRTTLEAFRSAEPAWETFLDIDAIAKADNANWVFKGRYCLRPEERLCIVSLSNGGKDAVVLREFDAVTKSFVPGGFMLGEAKHTFSWLDRDNLLLASDWGPGSLTASGYPFIVKRLQRGEPPESAKEVFRGKATDEGGASAWVLHRPDGSVHAVIFVRSRGFYATDYHILTGERMVRLPLPEKATSRAYVGGRAFFTLEERWRHGGQTFEAGALIAFEVDDLIADAANARAELVLMPGPRDSISDVGTTKSLLVVHVLENVKGAVLAIERGPKGWARKRLDLPDSSTLTVVSADDDSERIMVAVDGFLEPATLWLVDAASGKSERLKALGARFDAAGLVVEQASAVSKDGTRIPYFVVRRKSAPMDGSTPTLLYAYGGFQSSELPGYMPVLGKLWLEKGGAYVLANIRGGGEFGPAWHQAAVKDKRQRSFDDFYAVAERLIASRLTSPRRLGIKGGSNGGLLVSVAMTQRPELWNAVIASVPLFDMLRYHKLLAGASWIGEYGNPDIPRERAWLRRYSPYQALKAGRRYPEALFITSTKDDRVHPAHARKAVARLTELGYPVLYYENIDGGHSAAANLQEAAHQEALEYTYLMRKLMD